MDFEAEFAATRFGVVGIAVVEDEVQALVTLDVRIVTSFGVVKPIAVHIDERSEVGGKITVAMGRPGQDVVGGFIPWFAMMSDEIVDFDAGEVPDAVVLQHVHQTCGGIGRSERSSPVVRADLAKPKPGQVKAIVAVEAAKPQRVLENGRLAAACRHFPNGTIGGRSIEEIRVAGTIADDGGVDIIGIAARKRRLLSRRCKSETAKHQKE